MPKVMMGVVACAVLCLAAALAQGAARSPQEKLEKAKAGLTAARERIKRNEAEIAKLSKRALPNPAADKADAEYERMNKEANAAQSALDVHRKRVLDKLAEDDPPYIAAMKAADDAETKLDELRESGKATDTQIGDATQRLLEAESAVTAMEKAATERDGDLMAAKEATDLARAKANAARRKAAEARADNPTEDRLADLRRDLDLARNSEQVNAQKIESLERQIQKEKEKAKKQGDDDQRK